MKAQTKLTKHQSALSLTTQLKEVSDALLEFSPSHTQATQLREQLAVLLNRLDQSKSK